MGEVDPKEEARARGERALKTFIDAQSKASDAAAKLAKELPDLAQKIGDGNQGLVAVIADLIDAIDEHREEMVLVREAILRAGGINVDLSSFLGPRRKR